MTDTRVLRTWAVLLLAVVGPFVIAIGSDALFDYANRPVSAEVPQFNPNSGRETAAQNELLMSLHATLQVLFVAIGRWLVARNGGRPVLFVAVSGPVSFLLVILVLQGHIAK